MYRLHVEESRPSSRGAGSHGRVRVERVRQILIDTRLPRVCTERGGWIWLVGCAYLSSLAGSKEAEAFLAQTSSRSFGWVLDVSQSQSHWQREEESDLLSFREF